MRTLVVGAGPTGLVTAMLLAAEGAEVTVVDRDPGPPESDAAAVWQGWRRPGVNQFRQTHCLLPGGLRLLRDELPGAVDRLLALGGRPGHNMIAGTWGLPGLGGRRPEDDRYETVAVRRPVLEAALLAEAEQTPGVTVRRGVRVTGLLTGDARTAGSPQVTGVLTQDGESLTADLVVDAGGRNSPVAELLARIGAAPDEQRAETGFRYYTRFFRSADGTPGPQPPWPLCHHDSVSVLSAPGDNGTWSVTLVTSGRDQELRALTDTGAWQRALKLYPWFAPLGEAEPLTDVLAMGGTESRRLRAGVDGRPPVAGIVPVGDAWATVNPQFGTGMTMGFRHAALLRDAVRAVGLDDPADLAMRFDRVTETFLAPVWDNFALWDRHRLAEIDAEIRGGTYTSADEAWNLQVAVEAVRWMDPDVLRGLAEVACLLATPEEALLKSGLVEKVLALAPGTPRYAEPGPTRRALLTAVRGV
ncbi:FAD-dependent monooxygenase [Streptomyces sp. NBC_01622]|uniref:FAD-dependent oxidoreductase n=1 Tax=Streptomyces sp. NBC_01622 TaxID=2975903 RepID=UPI00386A8EDF|nr:FAD-dependent monooxygenase [Streptomyces sp. NBC_01622]